MDAFYTGVTSCMGANIINQFHRKGSKFWGLTQFKQKIVS